MELRLLSECPLCGGDLDNERPHVDLDHNLFRVGNVAIELTPQRAEIMDILVTAYPGAVKTDTILSRLCGRDYHQLSVASLRAQVSHIRKAIKPHADVESFWGRGYALVVAPFPSSPTTEGAA